MLSTYRTALTIAAVWLATLGYVSAWAQDASNWEFELVPISVWSVRFSGSFTVGNEGEDLQLYLRDLRDTNFRPAYSIHFEAWRGKWGVLAEATRLDLTEDVGSGSEPRQSLDFQNVLIEADVGYRIRKRMAVALGMRRISVDTTVTPTANGSVHAEQTWSNLIVGFLWRPRMSDQWSASVRFDVGGFDYPENIAWNVSTSVDYRFGRHTAIFFGIRFLDYDFISEGDHFAYDVTQAGPVAAVRFTW